MPRGRKNAKNKEMDGEAPPPTKGRKKRGAAAASSAPANQGPQLNLQQYNNRCDLPPYHHPQENPYSNYGPYNDYPPHQSHMMNRPMPGSSMMNPGAPPMNNRYMGPLPNKSDKIFPVDQPLVHNSANPNAPPQYVCGSCHKEVQDNDQAIMCESGCSFWYHRTCAGMTEKAFALLHNEFYAEWACQTCFEKSVSIIKCKP